MPRINLRLMMAVMLMLVITFQPARSLASTELVLNEKWSNIFADRPLTLHISVVSDEAFRARVLWTFAAQNNRVFPRGRGETTIDIGPNQPANVTLKLRPPSVRAGVILAGSLKVAVENKAGIVATLERTFWIFSENPFANRTQWLKDLKIRLFDSADDAPTVRLLKKLDIPFTQIRNVAAFDEVKEGFVVVGEGVYLGANLDAALIRLAARGVPVLCLAPKGGHFLLPSNESKDSLPSRMRWRQSDVIAELDKRFDSIAWPGIDSIVATSFHLKGHAGRAMAEFRTAEQAGWSWFESDFAIGKWASAKVSKRHSRACKLLIIGYPIVSAWHLGPTPRYLFAKLIQRVVDKPE